MTSANSEPQSSQTTPMAGDLSAGLSELADLINFQVGAWQELGYAQPPTPECATIPPLGERSAKAIKAGHEAIGTIDELIRRLHLLRGQLVNELRKDADIREARVDRLLANSKTPAAGDDTQHGDCTRNNPRAAGAASARGAQPLPPQGTMSCRYHGDVPYEHICRRPDESAGGFTGRALGELRDV